MTDEEAVEAYQRASEEMQERAALAAAGDVIAAARVVVEYEWGDPAKGCTIPENQPQWLKLRDAIAVFDKTGLVLPTPGEERK